MPLKISHTVQRGNTVPYPPLFNEINRNHGFVDLRGRPDLIEDIPELAESAALKALVLDLAQPASRLMTMGCDLGQHLFKRRKPDRRWTAGGYVQVARLPLGLVGQDALFEITKGFERHLAAAARAERWEADFGLCQTHLAFQPGATVEIQTLWIWLHAFSATPEAAQASREGAFAALHQGLREIAGLTPTGR